MKTIFDVSQLTSPKALTQDPNTCCTASIFPWYCFDIQHTRYGLQRDAHIGGKHADRVFETQHCYVMLLG